VRNVLVDALVPEREVGDDDNQQRDGAGDQAVLQDAF